MAQSVEAKSEESDGANLDKVNRDEVVERLKDRTDLDSRLLVYFINKEKDMELEIDRLRKAVERLLLEKMERSMTDSGSLPTKATSPATSEHGTGSGKKTRKATEIKTISRDIVAVPAIPKEVGGGSVIKIFAMDHATLAKAPSSTCQLAHRFPMVLLADTEQELTLRDSTLFRALETRELLHKRFMKPERSPTFQKMVQSFNQVWFRAMSDITSIFSFIFRLAIGY